ncbi:MAG: hypothetical protein GY938_14065, partial [Ketobacter sp.]|nr:hypothetical protein [Ketobacter sp.]
GTSVPKNVAAQARKAEELQKKLAAGELETPPAKDPTKPVDPDQPVVDPLATRIDPGAAVADPVIPAVPAADPATGDQIAALTHKLGALEGKYNSEIGRLSTIVEAQKTLIDEQTATIETMKATPAASPAVDRKFTAQNPDEFSGYGEEMVGFVNSFNALIEHNAFLEEQLKARPAGNNKDLEEIKGRVDAIGQTTAANQRDSYYRRLDQAVADWENINKSPGFITWADGIEPMLGVPRRAILVSANEKLDSARVIAIFQEYMKSAGIVKPAPEPVVPPVVDPLELEATPLNTGPVDPTLNTAPVLTPADLKKAEQDFVQKRITEEEFNKIYSQFQKQLTVRPTQ